MTGKESIDHKKSLKRRLVLQVSSFVVLTLILMIVVVSMLLNGYLRSHAADDLEHTALSLQQLLEQRVAYLVENTTRLAGNPFVINGLLDPQGRETYLPKLVQNFSHGRDLKSLALVDFDGRPVFKTQPEIPDYNSSPQLRSALTRELLTLYIEPSTHNLVMVVPIVYYNTTQGAIVASFALDAISKRHRGLDKSGYYKLVWQGQDVITNNLGDGPYISHREIASPFTPHLQALELELEIGVPESLYLSLNIELLKRVISLGLLLIVMAVFFSFMIGDSIARPILELYRRVKSTDLENSSQCSPLGTDDELDILAEAFDQRTSELREIQSDLEHRVEERTHELRQAKDNADAASLAKSVFLANMSHELRTPLNAVLGFSELMQDDPATTESQIENLTIINRSGEHLLTLINDVLEMSKIEAGRSVVEESAVDLGELVREIIDMMKNRAQEKKLQLLFEQSSSFPRFVSTDAPKLRQIIINLLSNAVKFTDEGGVTLRLGVDEQQGGKQLTLICEVEDSGVGISKEDMQKVFKPFVQVGQEDKRTGTGLGLSITKQYAELMGGELQVESELGKGTIFTASIIVDSADEEDVKHVLPSLGRVIGLEAGQPEYRILSVEDKWENQRLLQNVLEAAGLKVKCVENGEEAISVFAEWKPDLIWMDRRMPVMDGLEATRRIRKMDGGNDVIIIALTASVFKEQMNEVLKAGSDDFVRKPYKTEEIYDALVRHLGVRFIYEERGPESTDVIKTTLTTDSLNKISQDLIDKLLEAAIELDIELSLSVIDKIENEDALIATELRKMIENLDLKSMQELLKG